MLKKQTPLNDENLQHTWVIKFGLMYKGGSKATAHKLSDLSSLSFKHALSLKIMINFVLPLGLLQIWYVVT